MGDDLTLTVPITYGEAVFGTDLRVPTMDGAVTLRVAPGTPSGRILRVRGRGVPRRDGGFGDLLVTDRGGRPDQPVPRGPQGPGGVRAAGPAGGPQRPSRTWCAGTSSAAVMPGPTLGVEITRERAEFFFADVSGDDAKVLIISVAARMAGMHPQTLRQYDRMGLVQPGRAPAAVAGTVPAMSACSGRSSG